MGPRPQRIPWRKVPALPGVICSQRSRMRWRHQPATGVAMEAPEEKLASTSSPSACQKVIAQSEELGIRVFHRLITTNRRLWRR